MLAVKIIAAVFGIFLVMGIVIGQLRLYIAEDSLASWNIPIVLVTSLVAWLTARAIAKADRRRRVS